MLVKPEIFVGLYVCACLFLQASVCWTHKNACTQYICSKYMSGCFICSKVPCSPLMKLLLYKHTHALICTPHTHKTQRSSKQGRPLRGEDSFLGKWEPAGLDKHTHTRTHIQTKPRPVHGLNTFRLCLFTLSTLPHSSICPLFPVPSLSGSHSLLTQIHSCAFLA